MFIRIFVSSLIIFNMFIIDGQSQSKKSVKNRSDQTTRKLNKENPSVYIDFVKFDTMNSKIMGKSRKIVWLKLHNNLNTDVSFCYFDQTEKANESIGLHWEVEKEPPLRVSFNPNRPKDDTEVPDGYPIFDVCDTVKVKGGKSIEFPIPEDHFVKNTRIKIMFFYAWEDSYKAVTGFEPLHYVYFYAYNLPKEK